MKTEMDRKPIRPDRLRSTKDGSFAFLPHRFLQGGYLASLSKDELALYVVLVLAADRHGLSFYAYDRLCTLLMLDLETYLQARNRLIRNDLVAFDGTRFQVLALPEFPRFDQSKPLTTPHGFEKHDPATVRATILAALQPRR